MEKSLTVLKTNLIKTNSKTKIFLFDNIFVDKTFLDKNNRPYP